MSSKSVAILGAGPAGLLAAHAASQAGWDFRIFSIKEPSPMDGAQYLHEPIDGLTGATPDATISYAKVGTAEGYAAKVYGDPLAPTSWAKFRQGDHPAWALHAAYDRLRDLYWSEVVDRSIEKGDISKIANGWNFVFNSLPAPALCSNRDHRFTSQRVHFADVSFNSIDNFIVYNGRLQTDWYRTSSLFGHTSTEWSDHRPHPAGSAMREGVKPISTDCNCHAAHENLIRIGRFGEWRKAVLVNDAYRKVMRTLADYEARNAPITKRAG